LHQKFPTAPDSLLSPAEDLTPPDQNKLSLADMLENVNENYGKYYALQEKYNTWIEWYNNNKKIFDEVK
jgi:hypothetical protein